MGAPAAGGAPGGPTPGPASLIGLLAQLAQRGPSGAGAAATGNGAAAGQMSLAQLLPLLIKMLMSQQPQPGGAPGGAPTPGAPSAQPQPQPQAGAAPAGGAPPMSPQVQGVVQMLMQLGLMPGAGARRA